MVLHRCSLAEAVSVTEPWVTPAHPERQTLEALLSGGVIRYMESAHAGVVGALDPAEAERKSGLSSDLGATNERHDDCARITYYTLRAHEILHRGKPTGRAVSDLRTWLFPDDLNIVNAGYRESAGRASVRASQLTPEREALLTAIPVQDSNLHALFVEWNQMGAQMGALHDQRATPGQTAVDRVSSREARGRWLRAVKAVLNALEIEAETNVEARRILDRIANIEAEVARRLRAGASSGDELDDDPEPDPTTPAA